MDALSQEQFSALVLEYKDNLFRTAYCILRNTHDAEDAVCEAIYRSFRSLSTLKNKEAFRAWIYRITVNEARQVLRKRKNVVTLGALQEAAAIQEEQAWLWTYVAGLPDHMRIPVYLFYYEDMRISDIAHILGLSAGTVKSRLSRAREQLRRILSAEEVHHGF